MIIGNDNAKTSLIGNKEEEEDKLIGNKGLIGGKGEESVIGARQQEAPVYETVTGEGNQPVSEPADESISGEQEKEPQRSGQATPQEEDLDAGDYVADLALAIPRGVEGALEGLYGLADHVSGDNLLPDWNRDQTSAFGKSKTTIGRFGEGITQFVVGFIPGLGVASKAGKVLQLSKLGKASGAVSKALGGLAKGNRTLDRKTLKTLSRLKKATKIGVRNASAGFFSDFLVWKGEEERISNLLKNYEGMGDSAIVDWMAYDPDKDEGEIEGRFKNALEGLVVGELVGATFLGVKKGFQALPEKEKALAGLEKVFGKFREKNKKLSQQVAEGKEPNELVAIQEALETNILDVDEIKSITELDLRGKDASKVLEHEAITGLPFNEVPSAKSILELDLRGGTKKAAEKIKLGKIDVDKASTSERDVWLRKNSNLIPSTMSEASKKETIRDMLKEVKKKGEGAEGSLRRMEDAVVEKIAKIQAKNLKKAGVDGAESGPQAWLSHLRVVGDKPELRSLLSKVSREILKSGKKDEFDLASSVDFYERTGNLIDTGLESSGGKKGSLNLEALRNTPEDLRRVRVEAEVLFKALNVAGKNIEENLGNTKRTMDPTGAGYIEVELDGLGKKTMNSEESLTELFSSLDRFAALQELWADFGTQLSLGLRDRQLLYKTGETSIGRDVAGQNLPLGVAFERANSHAGKVLRRAHSRGYSAKKIIKDLEKIYKKTSVKGTGELDMGAFIKGLKNEVGPHNSLSRYNIVTKKGLAVSQEWYYNAILSSPTTWAVNLLGGALVLPLRQIESIIGGVATGNLNLVKANMRVMFDFQSFRESLKYAWKSGIDDDPRSISGFTGYRDDRQLASGGEISMKNPEGNTLKTAFNVIGHAVRHPSRILMAGDEFFKQMSFRARTKTSLAVEGYKRGLNKEPQKLAEFINDGFDELITKEGRFRNEDNVRKEAHLALSRRDTAGEITEDRASFVKKYLDDHLFNNELVKEDGVISNVLSPQSRAEMVEAGTDWALVNTFTNEVTNKFFKTTGKMATMSPWLGFVIPFVRTPSNILLFALGRTLPLGAGILPSHLGTAKEAWNARTLKEGFQGKTIDEVIIDLEMDGGMPNAKRQAEEMLSVITNEAGIKQAEATGRLAFGVMAAGTMLMSVESLRGKITGAEPESPGRRQVWRNTGKRAYSIKIGDTWQSYQRLDPFATMIGIMADAVHLHDEAMDEGENSEYRTSEEYVSQEPYLKTLFGVVATTMANNVSNKSYIKNLGELMEIFEEPERVMGNVFSDVVSSMAVPGIINWSQGVYEENPAILEARTLMDKIKRRLPEAWRGGHPVMPVRNIMGEVIRREGGGSLTQAMNPIYRSTESKDIVDLELEQHEVGRNVPASTRRFPGMFEGRQVDLTSIRKENGQTGFDRFLEIMGTVKTGGAYLTLRQDLRNVIDSHEYQALPPITSANSDKNHPRTKMLTKSFGKYRGEAMYQLTKELSDFSR
jgi:hypothetical protein